jgi:hypothetical protein
MPERDANHFVRPLPSNPNLEKQRKLAEALARNYWRGDLEAIERVRALHPNLRRRKFSPLESVRNSYGDQRILRPHHKRLIGFDNSKARAARSRQGHI